MNNIIHKQLCVALLGFILVQFCVSEDVDSKEIKSKNIIHDLHLPAAEASNLCKEVQKSIIHTDDLFLWTQVQSVKEQESQQENTFNPGCYAVKYNKCSGKTRYPVEENCGFFDLAHDELCSNGKTTPFTPTQSVHLTHGQVNHLCLSVRDLPSDDQFQIKFIPIKINLAPTVKPKFLAEECIRWAYHPCGLTGNIVDGNNCNTWVREIDADSKCTHYTDMFRDLNMTYFAQFPSPLSKKTDFVESTELEQGTSIWTTDFLSQVVKCSSKQNRISCEITPAPKGGRVKRSESEKSLQTPITRVKRQCCSLYSCRPCGIWGGWRLPRCNCANRPDNYCESGNYCDRYDGPDANCGAACDRDF